jgi:hypothetical protein
MIGGGSMSEAAGMCRGVVSKGAGVDGTSGASDGAFMGAGVTESVFGHRF